MSLLWCGSTFWSWASQPAAASVPGGIRRILAARTSAPKEGESQWQSWSKAGGGGQLLGGRVQVRYE